MPMYEFTCQNKECKHTSEKLVKMDTKSIECSKCSGTAVKVVSLPSNPKFSGGGWTPKFHGMGPRR
jgi:putative FmdB family regulatory protein